MTDYQNALELARQYYGPGQNEFLDTIFPELRESEDEQARRFLLAVADNNLDVLHSLKTETHIGSKGLCMVADDIKGWEKARAWLKKQQEQKPAEQSGSSEKPNNHWKPSREQIDALLTAVGSARIAGLTDLAQTLESLWKDLKKL